MPTLKGRSLESWKKWVDEELKPPHKLGASLVYVMEAFQEALSLLMSEEKQEFKVFMDPPAGYKFKG